MNFYDYITVGRRQAEGAMIETWRSFFYPTPNFEFTTKTSTATTWHVGRWKSAQEAGHNHYRARQSPVCAYNTHTRPPGCLVRPRDATQTVVRNVYPDGKNPHQRLQTNSKLINFCAEQWGLCVCMCVSTYTSSVMRTGCTGKFLSSANGRDRMCPSDTFFPAPPQVRVIFQTDYKQWRNVNRCHAIS